MYCKIASTSYPVIAGSELNPFHGIIYVVFAIILKGIIVTVTLQNLEGEVRCIWHTNPCRPAAVSPLYDLQCVPQYTAQHSKL